VEEWRFGRKPVLIYRCSSMKRIYIEGKSNPGLRASFVSLLQKELAGTMPRVVMGDGISQTVSKFRTAPLEQGEERYLVVDSDEKIADRADLVKRVNSKCSQKNCKVEATEDNTFFMEQEVEAWILSQPEALKKRGISKGLPVSNITSISKPSEMLSQIYSLNQKSYHKTKEFPIVFKLLESDKLKAFSSEYKSLIDKLK
jgi:hypothetical protein